jgi:GT2 family glycosyltransferase
MPPRNPDPPVNDAPVRDLPSATLIIPSRNRGDLLRETVQAVLEGESVPDDILVIDQSDEPEPELERMAVSVGPRLRYIWTTEPGTSRARNLGIREAKHDVLLFIDDDVHVTPTWYASMLAALDDAGRQAAVTGRVRPDPTAPEDGFVPSTIDEPDPVVYAGRIGTDILYSNNMGLRREIIEVVGPFDERLGGGTHFQTAEDNDLAFRILEAGFQIRYSPEAVVYHRAWRSRSDYHALSWSYGYGQGAYYAKHFSLRDRYMLGRFCHDLTHRFLRMARFARRQPHRAVGQLVYMAGMVIGAARWLLSAARRKGG